ncbi:MAG TPA: carboxypeptidase-like regulatory domain-containing protein, partial [Candidatus Cybelea sp.]|nr:carboxypeptidase-like regulatory domain-containing protein [Candidatus Cybelea sp.]
MRKSLTTLAVLTFALVFFCAQPASAGTTGAISGVITDTQSQPMSGVSVTASSPSQTARTTTDAFGGYRFASLAPDVYTVSV